MTANEATINKANIIVEALPYINKLTGKVVVIKYGGNAMTDAATLSVLQDIATLKMVGVNPVLVHGGGPEINAMLKRLNIPVKMVDGMRVTDRETMDVVQMVLGGKINKDLTAKLNTLGVKAVGLCGKDAAMLTARKLDAGNGVDYGFAGEIRSVNAEVLRSLAHAEYIPVISSIGTDEDGNSYNINADSAASAVACALKAEKLIFLTDIDGVRLNERDPDSLIPVLSIREAERLLSDNTISGGMRPKVMACVDCVKSGVRRVHIINGAIPHPILLEIFTDTGIGTMFTN